MKKGKTGEGKLGYRHFQLGSKTMIPPRRPTTQAAGPYAYASLVLDANALICRAWQVGELRPGPETDALSGHDDLHRPGVRPRR